MGWINASRNVFGEPQNSSQWSQLKCCKAAQSVGLPQRAAHSEQGAQCTSSRRQSPRQSTPLQQLKNRTPTYPNDHTHTQPGTRAQREIKWLSLNLGGHLGSCWAISQPNSLIRHHRDLVVHCTLESQASDQIFPRVVPNQIERRS